MRRLVMTWDVHMSALALFLLFFTQANCLTAEEFSAKFSLNISSEKGWFRWAWGAESTVSVVDRSPVISFASRPAAFGEEINGPILGYVLPLSSFTEQCANRSLNDPPSNFGCPTLCVSGPNEPDPSEPWIALVQRGKCEFVNKVREAQRLGARAVVVGGDNPEVSGFPDTLVNMYSPEDSSDVRIAATFIKYSDYVELSTLIAASNTSHAGLRTLSLLITAEYSAWEWYSPIVTFIIILLLPSILTFLTLLIHRIRAARAAQRERAPEDIVHGLPWRVWTGTGWEKHEGNEAPGSAGAAAFVDLEQGLSKPYAGGDLPGNNEAQHPSTSRQEESGTQPWFETQMECAICLSEFEKGDKVRVLPCHHIFHMAEVDEWLIQRKKLCPVCKADVTQPHPDSPSPRENAHDADEPTERTPLLGNTRALDSDS
ncbi:e3 ubiquitin-protein ligase rnf13-like [Moniliophthora roreri MCA 2997]|uniref:RING-type E3 ubiquitin transferase n=1 Tax=Moniliophthora roreri (strain MCA 2997) TaxID=1381753 RepID=V2XDD4_MONRO|nr:e3 ubiquitin-protein ligase rnf13-like [Moniliophthora roreri MCA 2997]KAI3618160.1 e3 ubiquitin-protein ligase rnf13-like [Moniliophthora roreri]